MLSASTSKLILPIVNIIKHMMDFPYMSLEEYLLFISHIPSYYDDAHLSDACIFMLSVCVWEWPKSYKRIHSTDYTKVKL